jgi:CheY-like chemotaxis protein
LDILIVEDNVQVRERMAAQIARIAGVSRVRVAVDGPAALLAIAEAEPDVLVLDIQLPVLNGLGVLDALRVAGAPFPVIAMSSAGEYRAACLAKGAGFFFDKASETESLFATVAGLAGGGGGRTA